MKDCCSIMFDEFYPCFQSSYFNKSFIHILVFWKLFLWNTLAQDYNVWFSQAEMAVQWNGQKEYTPQFSLTHRLIHDTPTHRGQFIEWAHMSNFELKPNHKLGLGILYRSAKPFHFDQREEWRFVQQLTTTQSNHTLSFSHRMRSEQRWFTNHTRYRLRYRLGVKPINVNKHIHMMGHTEMLWTGTSKAAPTYELRVGLGLGKWWTDVINMQALLEYRHKKPPSNLFFHIKTHFEL